jgi:2'-5' RNA ligase
MRTFIAVEPPDAVRKELGSLTGRLRTHLPDVRWVNPWNIHLTLRFLGEIDHARIQALEAAVTQAASQLGPFELVVGSLGFFGDQASPRVIWLGLENPTQLVRLAEGVEKEVVEAGFGRTDKPFKPHLTLARVKKRLASSPNWERIRGELPEKWPAWPVEEVCIIKSTLTPGGPVYETLVSCALKREAYAP